MTTTKLTRTALEQATLTQLRAEVRRRENLQAKAELAASERRAKRLGICLCGESSCAKCWEDDLL